MKLFQDINGKRELSDTNLNDDAIITLKCSATTNEALLVQEEILFDTEGETKITNAKAMVTYLDVTGWNESKQKFIRISAVNPHTGEDMDKDSMEMLQVIQSIQIYVHFLTEDLEESWGYIESFKVTSHKDKCFISFSRYDDEERDKEHYNFPGVLDTSKAICIEKIKDSKISLNFYE